MPLLFFRGRSPDLEDSTDEATHDAASRGRPSAGGDPWHGILSQNDSWCTASYRWPTLTRLSGLPQTQAPVPVPYRKAHRHTHPSD